MSERDEEVKKELRAQRNQALDLLADAVAEVMVLRAQIRTSQQLCAETHIPKSESVLHTPSGGTDSL